MEKFWYQLALKGRTQQPRGPHARASRRLAMPGIEHRDRADVFCSHLSSTEQPTAGSTLNLWRGLNTICIDCTLWVQPMYTDLYFAPSHSKYASHIVQSFYLCWFLSILGAQIAQNYATKCREQFLAYWLKYGWKKTQIDTIALNHNIIAHLWQNGLSGEQVVAFHCLLPTLIPLQLLLRGDLSSH